MPSLSSCPGGAIILTSERALSTDRLVELATTLLAVHDPTRRLRETELLDNIHTNLCKDIDALDHALSFVLPALLRSRHPPSISPLLGHRIPPSSTHPAPIRLLIIDSITALLRGETAFSSTAAGLTQRSRHLCFVADKLKALAVEFRLAVVVVNQVSDVFTRPTAATPSAPSQSNSFPLGQFVNHGREPPMLYATQARWFSGQSESLQKEASLGIVWANAVNTRVMLSRTGRRRLLNQDDLSRRKRPKPEDERQGDGDEDVVGAGGEDHKPTLVRRMHLVFSPFAPPSTVDYVITESGVHSLPDSRRLVDLGDALKRRATNARLAAAAREGVSSQELESSPRDVRGRDEDDFGEEVFDDMGDLPAGFWQGEWDVLEEEPLAKGVAV